ncbi:MAG: polyamine aminopropyltransferase [Candidatus Delongbacteria bacterium]|nr:polyamine aminopropyltransferase [Candidatus Delongbacteria bacterium]MBN2836509.1 polyamine aminopropyltransferase [Candidatus Delongbacteria bacterium]
MGGWFTEKFSEDHLNIGQRTSIKFEETLFKGKSEFQTIEIVRTDDFGKMLLLDNIVMLNEKFEFTYHEMISHVPLSLHPNPKKVLIIGGGDGGTATEVVKNPNVDKCVTVEIDKLVVDKCREFFPALTTGFSHPKSELIIDDGIKYMQNHKNSFDIIIIDSTDPFGPAEGLFKKAFYIDVFNSLKTDGIVVAQSESPFFHPEIQKDYFEMLKSIFPSVSAFTSAIPFYPSGFWTFSLSCKTTTDFTSMNFDGLENYGKDLKYFNPDICKACFSLPNFMKKNVGL